MKIIVFETICGCTFRREFDKRVLAADSGNVVKKCFNITLLFPMLKGKILIILCFV